MLVRFGVPLWCDNDIPMGKWEAVISEKIKDSAAVILFLTKSCLSDEKPYVRREFDLAELFEKKIYVIHLYRPRRYEDIPDFSTIWWTRLKSLRCLILSEYPSEKEALESFVPTITGRLKAVERKSNKEHPDKGKPNPRQTHNRHNAKDDVIRLGQILGCDLPNPNISNENRIKRAEARLNNFRLLTPKELNGILPSLKFKDDVLRQIINYGGALESVKAVLSGNSIKPKQKGQTPRFTGESPTPEKEAQPKIQDSVSVKKAQDGFSVFVQLKKRRREY